MSAIEWRINDGVDCPGLDAAADFVVAAVSVTDLNGDGKAEVTIPYTSFCGGGADVSIAKHIALHDDFLLQSCLKSIMLDSDDADDLVKSISINQKAHQIGFKCLVNPDDREHTVVF